MVSLTLWLPHHHLVTPLAFREWHKVAVCETAANWKMRGPVYSGALGILNSNWLRYAPKNFPRNAGLATPAQQVFVAMRINKGFPVPDQYGCQGSW